MIATMQGMARPKLPEAAEMRQFVADCHQRFGVPLSNELDGQTLKHAYQGWAAVVWIEENSPCVVDAEIQQDGKGKVKAGNSTAKRLWRERVVFVPALQRHYRIPRDMPKTLLRAGVRTGLLPAVVSPEDAPEIQASPIEYVLTLANKPSVLIDRATRGPSGWNNVTLQYRESFEDGLSLNYFEENAAPDTLRTQLLSLDPRTSDVWRLLTAKALENERDDLFTPITIKPSELAQALGLKLHPNGSVRAKDSVRCTQSLSHLARLWLTLPNDPDGPQKRVLSVMEIGRARKIDGVSIPSSWTLVLGDWAKYFPRSYAPIFRSLVELPANSATNVWAKQIGTELTYWLRESGSDLNPVRYIEVRALLSRASIMQDVLDLREQRNLNRAIERFESTLELLGNLGLHERWGYESKSAAKLDLTQGKPEFFDVWLSSLVELQVPETFLRSIAELVETNR